MPSTAPPPLPIRPASLLAAKQEAKTTTNADAVDRRALLRYVYEVHGGAGSPADADFDAVNVNKLLAALRSGSSHAVTGGVLVFPGIVAKQVVSIPLPTAEPAVYKSTSEESDDEDTASSGDDASSTPASRAAAPPDPREPLALDVVNDLGDDISNVAYQSFVATDLLSARSSPLHQFARGQLGVAPAFAEQLARTLPGSGVSAANALTLRVPAYLLTAKGSGLGPKDLRKWQQTQGCVVAASLPSTMRALRERLLVAEPTAVAQACTHFDGASWEMPPSPVGVLVYQALVRCQWDDLDESSGAPVEEAPQFLKSLQLALWPGLGLTARAHSAHIAFSALQRWLSSGSIEALRIARREMETLADGCQDGSLQATGAEQAHFRATLGPVASRTIDMLSDLHRHFSGAKVADAVDGVLACAHRSTAVLRASRCGALDFTVESCILASINAAYGRFLTDAGTDTKCDHMVALADNCCALVDSLTEQYAHALERLEPRAMCIAVTHLQSVFKKKLDEWLSSPSISIYDAVTALKGAASLVARIQTAAIAGADGVPPAPIDCATVAETRALAWVNARIAEMHSWAQRGLASETWTLDPSSRNLGALSAVELVRAANEGIDGFFRLKLHQSAPATVFAKGTASVVHTYASSVLRSIGDPDLLLPSPPQLTRYKKEAVELLIQEHAKTQSIKEQQALPTPNVDQLLLMFNTMCLLLDESRTLDQCIQRQWASLEQQVGTLRRGAEDARLTGYFAEAQRTCTEAKDRAAARLAGTITFHHLRDTFIDGAFLFGTANQSGRLPIALLDPLNDWMMKACSGMVEEERNTMAAAILKTVVRGLRFVLLDGGPCRLFTEDDAPALRADLAQVLQFFQADGEGIPQEEVEALLSPVERIVDVMARDTYSLVALYDAAQPPIPQVALMKVIAHRGDRAASKWLKSRMHTPKAVGFFAEKLQLINSRLHKQDKDSP